MHEHEPEQWPLEAARTNPGRAPHDGITRRDLLRASAGAIAATALGSAAASAASPIAGTRPPSAPAVRTERRGKRVARTRFGVVGANHGHINSMADAVIRGGGDLASYYIREPDLAADFARRFPSAKQARSEAEVLEDPSIALVCSAAIPDERAPLGVRVMRHGKDYMVDKPGITSLQHLAAAKRAQQETGRIYSISYSERLENRATVRAGDLVAEGAIGDVVQTLGMGPHRITPSSRPAWFWDRARYGGIICDIGSHQVDQFLFFTGSTRGEVVAAQVGNFHHPDHPDFEDFGDAMFRGDGGVGYVRLDWFTPDGLPTWGDGRLTILCSKGFIELRKYIDVLGRPGGNHLFITDGNGVRHIDCDDVELPYGPRLVDDVLNRTETAMSQAHCFLATELALTAQARATNAVMKA
jgi:predicted dehydrogenase